MVHEAAPRIVGAVDQNGEPMQRFRDALRRAVAVLERNLDKKIRVVSNFDADGISAGAILTKALLRKGCDVHTTIIKQLRPQMLDPASPVSLHCEKDDVLIFADLGSGQVDFILPLGKPTIILDHHHPQNIHQDENFVQVNPEMYGISEEDVSAAGLSYFFAETLDPRNKDLAGIVMVGAIGDIQEREGEIQGLNKIVLQTGIENGAIKKRRGIRIFGRSSRALHSALAMCMDPLIPGVSGDESSAVQFLSSLGIPVKVGNQWRTLEDLTEEEERKLASAIIMERIKNGEQNVENIFGDVYNLPMPYEFSNAKELATAINACGRMGNAALGVQLLAGDKTAVDKTRRVLNGYRKLIGSYISWVKQNVGSANVIVNDAASFIVAGDNIHENMIGTTTSVICRGDTIPNSAGKPMFGMAVTEDGENIKISGRADGMGLNLKDILNEACAPFGGEGGGHTAAAGGYIRKGDETKFISFVSEIILRQKQPIGMANN